MVNRIFLYLFIFGTTILAQSNLEHILKVYPNWKTNFKVSLIDFSELKSGGPPKDGIPAILNPIFTTQQEAANWLNKSEPVIAVSINGMSKAYPLQILLYHEIVNDRIGRTPLLVTFCPLCYSGIVFNRRINNISVKFGVSGLLRNSDMVMYDHVTESFWQQFTGQAIVGDLAGNSLKIISSQIISFKQFVESYPEGLVLSKNTGFKRPYGMTPYINYDDDNTKPFLFTGIEDSRLPQNQKIIGVSIGNVAKAYPYPITSKLNVINDNLNNENIVIIHFPGTFSVLDTRYITDSKDVGSTGVFSADLDGKTLTFIFKDNVIMDDQTNSIWNITGKCIKGKLQNKQLRQIQYGDYFSFAWFAFKPESSIYKIELIK